MPWKPEIKTINEDKWHRNALVFASETEAEESARDLFHRWTLAAEFRAVEVDDTHTVNYRYSNGALEHVAGSESGPKPEAEEGEEHGPEGAAFRKPLETSEGA